MNWSVPRRIEKALLLSVAILIPCVMFAGALSPWPEAKRALAKYGRGPYVAVGGAYRYSASDVTSTVTKSRTYVVMDRSLETLSVYSVISKNGDVSVEEVRYGLLWSALGYGVIYAGLWWRLSERRNQRRAV